MVKNVSLARPDLHWYVGLAWCCISLFNIDFNTSLREKSQTCLKGNISVQIMGTPSSHQSSHKMDDSCPYRDENTSYNYVLHTSLLQFLGHSFNHFKSHNINHVSRVMLRFSFVIHTLPPYLKKNTFCCKYKIVNMPQVVVQV